MSLAHLDLDALRVRVLAAYERDLPLLNRFRTHARSLRDRVKPLRPYSVNAVSFVSADGGDNRIAFNPATVELVRVVDSRGHQCVLDAIPSSTSLEELNERGGEGTLTVQPLARLCTALGLKLSELSYILKAIADPTKSTGAIRCYRDIVEWSVLVDLVSDPSLRWGGDTILVRDGLLRTKSFRRDVFPQIDALIRAGVDRHLKENVRLSVVGVAKQSAVLSRLALALELEATFHRPVPCYVRVDPAIEQECYNYDRTWLETYESSEPQEDGSRLYQSLGKLFLVKFGDRPFDPVWPVDVAEWQVPEVERILGQLAVDAQQGFPIPDYPMCIQRAHDFAKLTGLEVTVLQDELVRGACSRLTPEEAERVLRMKHLGQSLAALRYKEA